MPWRLIEKRTNSNIHHTVTDGPFAVQICHRCTFDPKKKNPYWDIARLCWKINSFLPEVSVCRRCTEKIIKIEKAFSVLLWASQATCRSFQQSPQLPAVTAASSSRHSFQQSLQQTSNLIHNWQLQMQDGIFQSLPLLTVSSIRRLYVDKRLLIEVVTVAPSHGRVDLTPTFISNRGRDRRIGVSTWHQH